MSREASHLWGANPQVTPVCRRIEQRNSTRVKYFRCAGIEKPSWCAVMSHAHGDHDDGAAYLQDSIPGVRLVYGAADWDAIDKLTDRPGGKPKRDMVGADGSKISVGDASIQIVTMPGHTPGTLSYLFRDKRQRQAAPRRLRRRDGDSVQWHASLLRSGFSRTFHPTAPAICRKDRFVRQFAWSGCMI